MSAVPQTSAGLPVKSPDRFFIGGKWEKPSSSTAKLDVISPFTEKVILSFPEAQPADVDRAVAAARKAFDGPWRKETPENRGKLLVKLAIVALIANAAVRVGSEYLTYLEGPELQKLKDAKVPVIIVHGDADELVPVANSRAWAETMKQMGMTSEYVEQPGISHGPVIEAGMAPIYAFFAKHTK